MGNQTSAQVTFRNLINEIKYGADLELTDPNEAHYSYAAAGTLAAVGIAPFHQSGTKKYTDSALETANTRAFFAPDRPIYKMIFTTKLSDEDIAAFFNFDDVRFLRRYRPNQLAMVLYKCIEQIHYFTKYSTHLSDTTAVCNAVRIIGNSIPYLLEDTKLEVTSPEPCDFSSKQYAEIDKAWRAHGGRGKSIFADDFFFNFFWRNLSCSGESVFDESTKRVLPVDITATPPNFIETMYSTCPQLPPFGFRTKHTTDTADGNGANKNPRAPSAPIRETTTIATTDDSGSFLPFAHVLVRLVTDCCFVPYFTINGVQSLSEKLKSMAVALPSTGVAVGPSDLAKLFNDRMFSNSRQSQNESSTTTTTPSNQPAAQKYTTGFAASTAAPALFVSSSLLWYEGAFVHSEEEKAAMRLSKLGFGGAITHNRLMLLRCILSLFIERVVEGPVPLSLVAKKWRLGGSANSPQQTLNDDDNENDNRSRRRDDVVAVPYLSDLFADPTVNPLGATLCASLFNYVAAYQTKGVLPFTSYIGAEASEALLAMSGQVLNAFLDFDVRNNIRDEKTKTSSSSSPSSKLSFLRSQLSSDAYSVPFLSTGRSRVSPSHVHSMWAVADAICMDLTALMTTTNNTSSSFGGGVAGAPSAVSAYTTLPMVDDTFRSRLVKSMVEVIANPLYASFRRLGGSQKRVLCYMEYLHLLVRLLVGAGDNLDILLNQLNNNNKKEEKGATANNDRESSSSTAAPSVCYCTNLILEEVADADIAPRLVEALLFFIYNGTLHHKYFSEVQVVVFLLRILVEGDGVPLIASSLSAENSQQQQEQPLPLFMNRGNHSFIYNFLFRLRSRTPYEINPEKLGLPPMPPTASTVNADLVLLAMCSMLSEATPRWYLGLAPSAASIIQHICGIFATISAERFAHDVRVALVSQRLAVSACFTNLQNNMNASASVSASKDNKKHKEGEGEELKEISTAAATTDEASSSATANNSATESVLNGGATQAPATTTAAAADGSNLKHSTSTTTSLPLAPAPLYLPSVVRRRARGRTDEAVYALNKASADTYSSHLYASIGTSLSSIALFELRHSLDFTTQKNFLKKGDVCFQTTELMLSAVATLLTGGRLFGTGVSDYMIKEMADISKPRPNNNGEDGDGDGGEDFDSMAYSDDGSSAYYRHRHPLLNVPASALSLSKHFPSSLPSSVSSPSAAAGALELLASSSSSNSSSSQPLVFPGRDYFQTVAPLAASLSSSSEAVDNLIEYWFGVVGARKGACASTTTTVSVPVTTTKSSKKEKEDTTTTTNASAAAVDIHCMMVTSDGGGGGDGQNDPYNYEAAGDGGKAHPTANPPRLPSLLMISSTNENNSSRIVSDALRVPFRTPTQIAIATKTGPTLSSLYVLIHQVLIPCGSGSRGGGGSAPITADMSGNNNNNSNNVSSTAGRNELVISAANDNSAAASLTNANASAVGTNTNGAGGSAAIMKIIFSRVTKALCELFSTHDDNSNKELHPTTATAAVEAGERRERQETSAGSKNMTLSSSLCGPPYANLLSFPIVEWFSKACWATTQQHNLGGGRSAALFDARSSYMFLGSKRLYGDDVKQKIAAAVATTNTVSLKGGKDENKALPTAGTLSFAH